MTGNNPILRSHVVLAVFFMKNKGYMPDRPDHSNDKGWQTRALWWVWSWGRRRS